MSMKEKFTEGIKSELTPQKIGRRMVRRLVSRVIGTIISLIVLAGIYWFFIREMVN